MKYKKTANQNEIPAILFEMHSRGLSKCKYGNSKSGRTFLSIFHPEIK